MSGGAAIYFICALDRRRRLKSLTLAALARRSTVVDGRHNTAVIWSFGHLPLCCGAVRTVSAGSGVLAEKSPFLFSLIFGFGVMGALAARTPAQHTFSLSLGQDLTARFHLSACRSAVSLYEVV
jgi:hypothetical protein